jgi:alkylation response protein AidB-like acyl-CoA dehydrogenase
VSSDGPTFTLSSEQQEIRRLVRDIAENHFAPTALVWEENGEFPWANIHTLAQSGVLGVTIPTEFGGAGGSWLEAAVVLEEIGRCCYITAMAVLGEIGVQSQAILLYGTPDQKQRYLPSIASGELICAICITEPDTGSDLKAMRTAAVATDTDLIINGHKTLISRADVAGLFLVYVKFAGAEAGDGIGAVLVDRDTPGLEVGQRFQTLGGDGLFEVHFHDCHVDRDQVLVREDGMRRMLAAFNGQRCLNAAISVGIAQGAQDHAIAYAKARSQGGQPIADYQGIQWMLADNAIQIEAARLLVHRAAAGGAGSSPTRYEAAVAKTYANEMALRVTDSALQIFGGHGWTREMPAERYVRWARYGALGGGTPQIQRNGIAQHLLG